MAANTYLGMNVEALIRAIIAGVEANMSASDKVMYAGKLLGKDELLGVLNKLLASFNDVDAARKELTSKIAARDDALPDIISAVKAIDGGLSAKYSADPHTKAKLGIPPPPNRKKLTAAEKAVRAQKAQDTRDLRGTRGRRQKEKIKATGDYSLSISSGSASSGSTSPNAPAPVAVAAAPAPVVSAPAPAPVVSAPAPAPVITAPAPALVITAPAPAPVISAAPVPTTTPVAVTPTQPAPSASSSGDSAPAPSGNSNGVSNGSVAPMLMNGAGH